MQGFKRKIQLLEFTMKRRAKRSVYRFLLHFNNIIRLSCQEWENFIWKFILRYCLVSFIICYSNAGIVPARKNLHFKRERESGREEERKRE